MVFKHPNESDLVEIAAWNSNQSADFLKQWAGRAYTYPLTKEQLSARINDKAMIYSIYIENELIGTIEINSIVDTIATIGRFLINPIKQGNGIGTFALNEFLNFVKKEYGISKFKLFVFDFNIPAHKCYLKAGFKEINVVIRPIGWKAIEMEKEI